MTEHEEKAIEIRDKFLQYTPAEEQFEYPYAKECALIAIEEILNVIGEPERNDKGEALGIASLIQPYWIKVREAINKL